MATSTLSHAKNSSDTDNEVSATTNTIAANVWKEKISEFRKEQNISWKSFQEQLNLTQNLLVGKLRDLWQQTDQSSRTLSKRVTDLEVSHQEDVELITSHLDRVVRRVERLEGGDTFGISTSVGGSLRIPLAGNTMSNEMDLAQQAKKLLVSAPMHPPTAESSDVMEPVTEMHIPIYERNLSTGYYRFVVRNTDKRARRLAHFTCSLRASNGAVLQECARHSIMPGFEFALEFSVTPDDAPAFLEFHTTNRTYIAAQLDREEQQRGLMTDTTLETCVFILAIGCFSDVTSGMMYDAIEEDVFYYNLCVDVNEFAEAHDNATYIRYQREDLPRGTYVHTLRRNSPSDPIFMEPPGQTIFYVKHAESSDFLYREGRGTKTFVDTSNFLIVADTKGASGNGHAEKDEQSEEDALSRAMIEMEGMPMPGRISKQKDYVDYLVADDGYTTMTWRRLRHEGQSKPSFSSHGEFIGYSYQPESCPADVLFEVQPFYAV